jgi:hypothetical protein
MLEDEVINLLRPLFEVTESQINVFKTYKNEFIIVMI